MRLVLQTDLRNLLSIYFVQAAVGGAKGAGSVE